MWPGHGIARAQLSLIVRRHVRCTWLLLPRWCSSLPLPAGRSISSVGEPFAAAPCGPLRMLRLKCSPWPAKALELWRRGPLSLENASVRRPRPLHGTAGTLGWYAHQLFRGSLINVPPTCSAGSWRSMMSMPLGGRRPWGAFSAQTATSASAGKTLRAFFALGSAVSIILATPTASRAGMRRASNCTFMRALRRARVMSSAFIILT
mmetsp:Transcript_73366/g.203657  ORF Transcript_73366/g.203657 Transcript_73366/m.203657 type:complete len:206 (-) Transcript_73366:586-1203(-)